LHLLTLLTLASPAQATELVWDGHLRATGSLYDSLSLSDTNAQAEGTSSQFVHDVRLAPSWLLSDTVSMHVQFDMLDGVNWGDSPVLANDLVTGEAADLATSEAVQPPTTEDGAATLQNLAVTRAWAEAKLSFGNLRFGRMPIHWGTGMVFNAGDDGWNGPGDTADRIQLTRKAGDVYLLGAWESRSEGYVGEPDDLHGLAGAVVFQNERAAIGTYHNYRWQGQDQDRFSTYIADLWASADMGPAQIQFEFAAVLGGGDLESGANDVQLAAYGANIDLSMQSDKLSLAMGAGLAGGDGDTDDSKLSTFSFDPNFRRGLILFAQPLPTLEASVLNDGNGGRTTEAARSGVGISNAMYLNPRVGWALRDDLDTELSVLAAQKAKDTADAQGKGYGTEFDLSIRYRPMAHFEGEATLGILLPGTHYTDYEHEDLGGDFDRPVTAARITGTVSF
jgi:hypothetical protein